MAYSITYPWVGKREPKGPGKRMPALVPGVIVLLGILGMRLLIPEFDNIVSALLHPLTDGETMAAVGELLSCLAEGMPVDEAVTAFCLEILQHG